MRIIYSRHFSMRILLQHQESKRFRLKIISEFDGWKARMFCFLHNKLHETNNKYRESWTILWIIGILLLPLLRSSHRLTIFFHFVWEILTAKLAVCAINFQFTRVETEWNGKIFSLSELDVDCENLSAPCLLHISFAVNTFCNSVLCEESNIHDVFLCNILNLQVIIYCGKITIETEKIELMSLWS